MRISQYGGLALSRVLCGGAAAQDATSLVKPHVVRSRIGTGAARPTHTPAYGAPAPKIIPMMFPKDLTPLEKAVLLSGADEWTSRGNPRAGIAPFRMSDGPHGLRRQLLDWGEQAKRRKQADRQRADRTSGRVSEHVPARRRSAPARRRGGDNLGLGESLPATCFPTATAVADSWDPALAEAMGRALGEEARAQGVDVLLGPGINIKRSPLCGRNFEYYSEDPLLAGRMAAGLVRGVQGEGVAACPKHFAANGQELRRQASNSVVDERTLREIYLTAFEIAVREGRPWALMSSYNQVNGVYAHENRHLLTEILRDEWGFDGAVISDWGGSNSAVAAVRAGGSLEMPSPGYTSARAIMGALRSGRLSMTDLDARVAEVARLSARVHGASAHGARVHGARAHGGLVHDGRVCGERGDGASVDAVRVDGARVDDSHPSDTRTGIADASRPHGSPANDTRTGIPPMPASMIDAHHALARRVAEESAVLLKNELVHGAGDDVRTDARDSKETVGTAADADARPVTGAGASHADADAGAACGRDGIDSSRGRAGVAAGLPASGTPALPLAPGARIAVIGDMARIPRYQGSGSSKVNATREENLLESLRADGCVTVVGYAQGYERHGSGSVGSSRPRTRGLTDEAVSLAARGDVDAVVVAAGLDERSEAEGLDRSAMAMPRPQNDLIEALAAVCRPVGKPLVVVLVAGSPVELPWIDHVDAVLYAALSGQAGASAIARLLVGKANPCGHLAETWPLRLADAPTAGWYPARHRNAIYREGPFVGYRYHVTAGVPVRFPFGHGLSYSRFTYAGLHVEAGGACAAGRGAGVGAADADDEGTADDCAVGASADAGWGGADVASGVKADGAEPDRGVDVGGVTFTVTNDSDVPGATVAQLYVRAPEPRGPRPARELKGFAKVWLGPHESREVHIPFDQYTFRHWAGTGSPESGADANSADAAAAIVDGRDGVGDAAAAGPGAADSGSGWQVTSGDWTVMIGRSVDDIALATTCHVDGTVDPTPSDPRLGAYLTGRVKEVSDANLCVLFGVESEAEGPEGTGAELDGILSALPPLPGIDPEEPAEYGPNDPILDWVGSSSPIARAIARRLIERAIETRERHGEPDLDALFKLNMPPRVMVKLAGGLVDSRMVEGVVDIANGRTSRGLRRLALGFLRNLVANVITTRQLRARR